MPSSEFDLPALLLRIAREHEVVWIESLRQAVPAARRKFGLPMPTYVEEDYRQLARGYLAVLEEAVQQSGTVRRDAYIGSIVEGMGRTGIPYAYLVHVTVGSQSGLMTEWVAAVPEEHRLAAIAWLSNFFADYVADMVQAGIRFGESSAP